MHEDDGAHSTLLGSPVLIRAQAIEKLTGIDILKRDISITGARLDGCELGTTAHALLAGGTRRQANTKTVATLPSQAGRSDVLLRDADGRRLHIENALKLKLQGVKFAWP